MEKTIKEIFKDYNSNSFSLNSGKIKSINLFKKTNKLELIITAKDFIQIEDIYQFEKYLKNRFNIFEVNIKVEYTSPITVNIQKEWDAILCYMAHKHPLTKAFFFFFTTQIENNQIEVDMVMKVKAVLEAKGFDKALEKIIEDIYGEHYQIHFRENISEDAIRLYHEHAMQLEREAIEQAQRMAEEAITTRERRKRTSTKRQNRSN